MHVYVSVYTIRSFQDSWMEKRDTSIEVFKDINESTIHCLINIAFGETGFTEE